VAVLGGYDTAVISAPLQFIKQRWVANLAVKVNFPLRVHAIALDFVPEGPTLEQIAAYRRPVTRPRVSSQPGPGAAGS
jgi:hypothetical protein